MDSTFLKPEQLSKALEFLGSFRSSASQPILTMIPEMYKIKCRLHFGKAGHGLNFLWNCASAPDWYWIFSFSSALFAPWDLLGASRKSLKFFVIYRLRSDRRPPINRKISCEIFRFIFVLLCAIMMVNYYIYTKI